MIRRFRVWGSVPRTPSIPPRSLCVTRKLTGSRCCLSAASTTSPSLGSPDICLGVVIGIGPRADFQSPQLTRLDHRGEPRPSEPLTSVITYLTNPHWRQNSAVAEEAHERSLISGHGA